MPFLDEHWDEPGEQSSDNVSDNNGQTEQSTNASVGGMDATEKNQPDQSIDKGSDSSKPEEPKKLNAQEQARLHSLRNMLDASNARYLQASKKRPPVFAAGLEVKVAQGNHAGKTGVVLDADYIENRALVSLPDQTAPIWIGFRSLGHPE